MEDARLGALAAPQPGSTSHRRPVSSPMISRAIEALKRWGEHLQPVDVTGWRLKAGWSHYLEYKDTGPALSDLLQTSENIQVPNMSFHTLTFPQGAFEGPVLDHSGKVLYTLTPREKNTPRPPVMINKANGRLVAELEWAGVTHRQKINMDGMTFRTLLEKSKGGL